MEKKEEMVRTKEEKDSNLEGKYVVGKFCCNCNTWNFGESTSCHQCGHLFIKEIDVSTLEGYRAEMKARADKNAEP